MVRAVHVICESTGRAESGRRARLLAALIAAIATACSDGERPSAEAGSSGTGGGASGPVATAGRDGIGGPPSGPGGAASSPQPGSAGRSGAPSSVGGDDGMSAGNGAGATGGAGGSSGTGGAPSASSLAVVPSRALWTAVRYYAGATPSGRTSGPETPPARTFVVQNSGSSPVDVELELVGADRALFSIDSPSSWRANIAPGGELPVTVSLVTNDAKLPRAPAQDDGATVLAATLRVVSGGAPMAAVENYALVLTYAELEPTFGQILRAFPQWTTRLPTWLIDDANPNPGSPLPGPVAATDEIRAGTFQRLDAERPVTLKPLARFSPPGLVPYGWYVPGARSMRQTVGTLGNRKDPHTADQARLLEPPLASGGVEFTPLSEPFAVWMQPADVGILSSIDADSFDAQHRVRTWGLRDAAGQPIAGAYLVGGEEAANGDYQDYVFLLENVTPAP